MGKVTVSDKSGQNQELSAAQLNAIAALWAGQSITAAAEVVGVTRQTAQIVSRAVAAMGPPRGPKTAEDWVLSNWSTFG